MFICLNQYSVASLLYNCELTPSSLSLIVSYKVKTSRQSHLQHFMIFIYHLLFCLLLKCVLFVVSSAISFYEAKKLYLRKYNPVVLTFVRKINNNAPSVLIIYQVFYISNHYKCLRIYSFLIFLMSAILNRHFVLLSDIFTIASIFFSDSEYPTYVINFCWAKL